MKIFSISWWIGMLINTFITIMFIYILKVIFSKVNVPIVSNMVEQAQKGGVTNNGTEQYHFTAEDAQFLNTDTTEPS